MRTALIHSFANHWHGVRGVNHGLAGPSGKLAFLSFSDLSQAQHGKTQSDLAGRVMYEHTGGKAWAGRVAFAEHFAMIPPFAYIFCSSPGLRVSLSLLPLESAFIALKLGFHSFGLCIWTIASLMTQLLRYLHFELVTGGTTYETWISLRPLSAIR